MEPEAELPGAAFCFPEAGADPIWSEPEWEWDLGLPETTKKVAAPQHC